MTWKISPTNVLVKKYTDESHAIYKPILKSTNIPLVLRVEKHAGKYVRASDIETSTSYAYLKSNLSRLHLKVHWLGIAIDITESPILNSILNSTHVIINHEGKIKKAISRS